MLANIIIITLLAIAFVAAIRYLIKNGSCADCPDKGNCASCHSCSGCTQCDVYKNIPKTEVTIKRL